MARKWLNVPIQNKLFLNAHETVLTTTQGALENAYGNEAGGLTRFPGLVAFSELADNGPVYLTEWRDHMIAVTDEGRLYRLDEGGNAELMSGSTVSGNNRVIFDKTELELLMAAGDRIFKFDGEDVSVLSEAAPLTTHVVSVDSYVVAIEKNAGRFQHSEAGVPTDWPALNVFSADSRPDKANSLLITDFNEMLVGGPDTIEQWERLASGTTPFFRRWAVGEGVKAPYTMVFADNAVSVVNKRSEFVRISGQTGQVQSEDVSLILEAVTDWTGAWSTAMYIQGQKFILLKIPNYTNIYGTLGLTLVYDFRQQRWFTLYDWDEASACPTVWPGHSYLNIWGKHYVGCAGRICRLDPSTFTNEGRMQRMYLRTAHLDEYGPGEVVNVRARMRRGVGSNTVNPKVTLRCRRNNVRWTRPIIRGIGKAGDREPHVEFGHMGYGETFQFEVSITDNAPVELVKLELQFVADG